LIVRELKLIRSSLLWASLFFLLNCASYTQETQAVHSDFIATRYQSALEHLEASNLKDQDRNALLYSLEKALILDRLGNLDPSRRLLFQADRIADQLYTKSISKEIATYLVSEDKTDYSGEDYEKVAIHTFLALSFLEQSKLNEARVEAAKINNKISEINQQYGDQSNRYKEDAFAYLLSGLIYESKGEFDDAIIDYVKALKSYQNEFSRYSSQVPEALLMGLANVATIRGRKEIIGKLTREFPWLFEKYRFPFDGHSYVAFLEVGAIARKHSESFFLQINHRLVRYSWPVMERQNSFPDATKLFFGGRQLASQEAIDFSRIAIDNLEDKRLRYTVKSFVRLAAKAKIADELEKSFGPLGGLISDVFSAVTETADTRSWTLLPQSIRVARLQSNTKLESFQINGEQRRIPESQGNIHFLRLK